MKKIKIGLDLTKETKKVDLIVQGETNSDMDKIKESAKNVGLDLTKNQSSVIEYSRYLYIKIYILDM